VKALLKRPDLDVNKKDGNYGWTALNIASRHGQTNIMRELVKVKGIGINWAERSGFTPLMRAAQKGHLECVEVLLEQPYIMVNYYLNHRRDFSGPTALYLAVKEGHFDVVRRLTENSGKTR
jgi:ankyrin repeat protein